MKQIIDIQSIASGDVRDKESVYRIQESITTMAEHFWETLYNLTYDIKPMCSLYDAMKHLNDTDCSEEAFDVLYAMYLLIDDAVIPPRSINAEIQTAKYFMTEFIDVSESIIYEIDREYNASFAAYIRRKEEHSGRM